MITPEDQQQLEQLVREAKELPNFDRVMLFDLIFGGDFKILLKICEDDDRMISFEEQQLIMWFLNDFRFKLTSDPEVSHAALDVIFANL